MTLSVRGLCMFGAGVCKVQLYLIALGFVGQMLDNFFYVRPNNRLVGLSIAFFLGLALCWALRACARRAERRSGYVLVD